MGCLWGVEWVCIEIREISQRFMLQASLQQDQIKSVSQMQTHQTPCSLPQMEGILCGAFSFQIGLGRAETKRKGKIILFSELRLSFAPPSHPKKIFSKPNKRLFHGCPSVIVLPSWTPDGAVPQRQSSQQLPGITPSSLNNKDCLNNNLQTPPPT